MMETKKGYELEFLILRTFLKYVKLNNMYNIFRCSVNLPNRNRDLYHVIASKLLYGYGKISRLPKIDAFYMNAKSLDELLAMMHGMHGNFKIENNSKCQMIIMNMVNGLIHSCIEYAVDTDFSILEKLGEDVFTEVCKSLFGDNFVDKTAEAMPMNTEQMGITMPPPPRHGDRTPIRMSPQPSHDEFIKWLESHREQLASLRQTYQASIVSYDDDDDD
jgi:hypothetical protein